jgi:hypothetical protein
MPRKKSVDNPICMTPGCGDGADALLAFDNRTTSWHCAECMSPVTPEEDNEVQFRNFQVLHRRAKSRPPKSAGFFVRL